MSTKPYKQYDRMQPDVKAQGEAIASVIQDALPDDVLFGLFIVSKGEDGFMNWISNADRNDMISALKEWLAVQEGTAFNMEREQ